MGFLYKPPEWHNEGTEPQEELKEQGFVAGYKPPAAYFNWFFNRVYRCLKELIEKSEALETKVDTSGQVILGPADTPLDVNDTLFVVDGEPDVPVTAAFEGVAYTNMIFAAEAPDSGSIANWGQAESDQAVQASVVSEEAEDGQPSIIEGKLVVSEEAASDATFFAKITN